MSSNMANNSSPNNYSLNGFYYGNNTIQTQYYPSQVAETQQQSTIAQSHPYMPYLQPYYGQYQSQTMSNNMYNDNNMTNRINQEANQSFVTYQQQQQQEQSLRHYNYWYNNPQQQQFYPQIMPQTISQTMSRNVKKPTEATQRKQVEMASQTIRGQSLGQTTRTSRANAEGPNQFLPNHEIQTSYKPFQLVSHTSPNRIDSSINYQDSQQDMDENLYNSSRTLYKYNKKSKSEKKIEKKSRKKISNEMENFPDNGLVKRNMNKGSVCGLFRKIGKLVTTNQDRSSILQMKDNSNSPNNPKPVIQKKKQRFFARLLRVVPKSEPLAIGLK